jgi:hypothetical protein
MLQTEYPIQVKISGKIIMLAHGKESKNDKYEWFELSDANAY